MLHNDPIKINAAQYMGGGRAFGLGVISRNITPARPRPIAARHSRFSTAWSWRCSYQNLRCDKERIERECAALRLRQ
jgi:hypothetical protein